MPWSIPIWISAGPAWLATLTTTTSSTASAPQAPVAEDQAPQRQPGAARRRRPVAEARRRLAVVGLVGEQLVDARLELGRDAGERQAAAGRGRACATPPPAPNRRRHSRRRPAAAEAHRALRLPRRARLRVAPRPRPGRAPRRSSGVVCEQLARACRRRRSGRRRAARPGRRGRSSTGGGRRSASCGPRISSRSASWISCSTWTSTALVASSSTRIGGFDEQRPRDRDALALAAGERVAALADDRVVAVGSSVDELVGSGGAGRRLDLVERRVRAAVGDVVADRDREQERLVEHDADLRAQARERELAHVVPSIRTLPASTS